MLARVPHERLLGGVPISLGAPLPLGKRGPWGAHFSRDIGTGGPHITGVPISLLHRDSSHSENLMVVPQVTADIV